MRGRAPTRPFAEGSQLKVNLLLSRLPRLRDPDVPAARGFAGTFHANETGEQLQGAYDDAASGRIPALAPCEAYCHTLTDPSILGAELAVAGAHTMTVFALQMPARDRDAVRVSGAERHAALAGLGGAAA